MRNPFQTAVAGSPVVGNSRYSVKLGDDTEANPKGIALVNLDSKAQADVAEVAPAPVQPGVQKVEAITAVLNRNHLIAVYVLYVIYRFLKLPTTCYACC
ncbi:unnamed protein product [Periconia digitata]|uniref:Uncharacterized protein n=1 Tax=Periconia digitata TaxID=1303443 RepID=A0A9W4UKS1_9PLEO|nr:unnamed protein product [Periconia digitata]